MKKLLCLLSVLVLQNGVAQVRQNNALDYKNVYNYYLVHSNREMQFVEEYDIQGDPFFTPLIDGYRYNAFQDLIVNAEDKTLITDKIQLGKFTFVKKEFYPRWQKLPIKGYLIELDDENYLRVQKKINEGYNPKDINNNEIRLIDKISYYKEVEGKIVQVKKNENDSSHFYIEVGFNQSNFGEYLDEAFSPRNSIYYGIGKRFSKEKYNFRTTIFYSKNGEFRYYKDGDNTGKQIYMYNLLGIEFLLEKQLNKLSLFTGLRSALALKRTERLAGRRKFGLRFQDVFTSLDDKLNGFLPLAIPLGVSYEFAEDFHLELKYSIGISELNKQIATDNQSGRLNTLQFGFLYQL